jgi:hypothetical protein
VRDGGRVGRAEVGEKDGAADGRLVGELVPHKTFTRVIRSAMNSATYKSC